MTDVIVAQDAASLAEALRAPRGDVLFASADAVFPEGALERLRACAGREEQVATVSVFSNEGGLAGYPRLAVANAMPGSSATADIGRFFARENAGIAVEIPFAAGPCIYVTRKALEAVGAAESGAPTFDEALRAFCAAATNAGLRHVLCAEVYVPRPAGSTTRPAFATDDADLSDYLARDPARPLRRRVDLARLRASPRPRILLVTHDWGGGVERHVRDLAALLADACEVLVLRPEGRKTVHLRWLREGEEFEAWFQAAAEWPTLLDLLRSIGVARVHFHHVHELPREVLDIPRELGVAYDVTLHDSFPICPQYHLADPTGRYCGEPDDNGCRACLAGRPAQWPLDITEWRSLFHALLRDAGRVIAPSADIGERIHRRFADVVPVVWPHPETRHELPVLHKVVLLGGLSRIKGIDCFERCVEDAARRHLPLHFHVIGHIDRPLATGPAAPATIGGSYAEEDLARLVALERPDAFLFLSQVPESYSYTLGVAMQAGLPIVATNLGAFPERLRGYPQAVLIAPDAAPQAFNDALLALLRPAAIPIAKALPASALKR